MNNHAEPGCHSESRCSYCSWLVRGARAVFQTRCSLESYGLIQRPRPVPHLRRDPARVEKATSICEDRDSPRH